MEEGLGKVKHLKAALISFLCVSVVKVEKKGLQREEKEAVGSV